MLNVLAVKSDRVNELLIPLRLTILWAESNLALNRGMPLRQAWTICPIIVIHSVCWTAVAITTAQ